LWRPWGWRWAMAGQRCDGCGCACGLGDRPSGGELQVLCHQLGSITDDISTVVLYYVPPGVQAGAPGLLSVDCGMLDRWGPQGLCEGTPQDLCRTWRRARECMARLHLAVC
jgi:hypothetical protein